MCALRRQTKVYNDSKKVGEEVKTFCELKKKEVLVGYLHDRKLYKLVKSNKKKKGKGMHYFIKYGGYGIQSTVFPLLDGLCDTIILISNDSGSEWHVPFNDWKLLPDVSENAGKQKVYKTTGIKPTKLFDN